ncbi:hypothetical protein SJAG_00833 [Schizosaccharomyces japonicus yFS275]|uniref:Uncharacterized protein n=1 Tax=Schizosaccharomyces japonicus (strain yFS275 / FY16936) TaxID=402676 RepID=B6JWQ4_SCHJY|nr:hypothetical protein SJAG_00833 [Schizosaccharomyces japonicus yFS275]EEB05805.1 hypothetical protein SJAG_00833 [Schizosaccharomyces japonicus yFS275]
MLKRATQRLVLFAHYRCFCVDTISSVPHAFPVHEQFVEESDTRSINQNRLKSVVGSTQKDKGDRIACEAFTNADGCVRSFARQCRPATSKKLGPKQKTRTDENTQLLMNNNTQQRETSSTVLSVKPGIEVDLETKLKRAMRREMKRNNYKQALDLFLVFINGSNGFRLATVGELKQDDFGNGATPTVNSDEKKALHRSRLSRHNKSTAFFQSYRDFCRCCSLALDCVNHLVLPLEARRLYDLFHMHAIPFSRTMYQSILKCICSSIACPQNFVDLIFHNISDKDVEDYRIYMRRLVMLQVPPERTWSVVDQMHRDHVSLDASIYEVLFRAFATQKNHGVHFFRALKQLLQSKTTLLPSTYTVIIQQLSRLQCPQLVWVVLQYLKKRKKKLTTDHLNPLLLMSLRSRNIADVRLFIKVLRDNRLVPNVSSFNMLVSAVLNETVSSINIEEERTASTPTATESCFTRQLVHVLNSCMHSYHVNADLTTANIILTHIQTCRAAGRLPSPLLKVLLPYVQHSCSSTPQYLSTGNLPSRRWFIHLTLILHVKSKSSSVSKCTQLVNYGLFDASLARNYLDYLLRSKKTQLAYDFFVQYLTNNGHITMALADFVHIYVRGVIRTGDVSNLEQALQHVRRSHPLELGSHTVLLLVLYTDYWRIFDNASDRLMYWVEYCARFKLSLDECHCTYIAEWLCSNNYTDRAIDWALSALRLDKSRNLLYPWFLLCCCLSRYHDATAFMEVLTVLNNRQWHFLPQKFAYLIECSKRLSNNDVLKAKLGSLTRILNERTSYYRNLLSQMEKSICDCSCVTPKKY